MAHDKADEQWTISQHGHKLVSILLKFCDGLIEYIFYEQLICQIPL